MVGDGGEEGRRQVPAQHVELRRGDRPAVVQGAAQGDDLAPGAAGRRPGVALLAGGLTGHGVERVGEPRHLGVEPGRELAGGGEAGQRRGGGERRQGLDRQRGDAQEGELALGARLVHGAGGPPPSWSRRCMK